MIGLCKLRLQLNAGKRRANLTRDSKVLVFSTTPRSSEGTDLFARVKLRMIDKQSYPSEGHTKKVPIKVINIFTLIQIDALATLWVLKSSSLGILFPPLIALLVPLRQWLSKHFEEEHLTALDEPLLLRPLD